LFYFLTGWEEHLRSDLFCVEWNWSARINRRFVYYFQGKGLQKTFWLDGREGLSLPLLRDCQQDATADDDDDDESARGVQTVDE